MSVMIDVETVSVAQQTIPIMAAEIQKDQDNCAMENQEAKQVVNELAPVVNSKENSNSKIRSMKGDGNGSLGSCERSGMR